MKNIKIKWLGETRNLPIYGQMKKGREAIVFESHGKNYIEQGLAELAAGKTVAKKVTKEI